jgi:hypothetical protein
MSCLLKVDDVCVAFDEDLACQLQIFDLLGPAEHEKRRSGIENCGQNIYTQTLSGLRLMVAVKEPDS